MTALHTIDLDYRGTPEAIAVYLLVGSGRPVLVETGPGVTTGALTAGLREHGFAPGDVGDVLITHIHFDHAGAAGWMASHGARVHVHEFGVRHLVDPSRLIDSATRIYRDRMGELWGDILPVPAAQVNAVHDGDEIQAGGLTFRAIETPGHARHHHAYVLEIGGERIAFTGDAAATFVREAPSFVSLPTPPPEFDLEAWLGTLDRLDAERFDRIFPTHYGAVDDPSAHYVRVRESLTAHVEYVRSRLDAGMPRDAVLDAYRAWFIGLADEARVPAAKLGFYAKDNLPAMNLSGIERYLKKQRENAPTARPATAECGAAEK